MNALVEGITLLFYLASQSTIISSKPRG